MKGYNLYKPVVGLFYLGVGYGLFGCGASSKALQKPVSNVAAPDSDYVNVDTARVNVDTSRVSTSGIGRVGRVNAGIDTALAGVGVDTNYARGHALVNETSIGVLNDYLERGVSERDVDSAMGGVGYEIGCSVDKASIAEVNKGRYYRVRVHSKGFNPEGHIPRNVEGVEINYNPVSIYRRFKVSERKMPELLAEYLTRNSTRKDKTPIQEGQVELYKPNGEAVAARYRGVRTGLEHVVDTAGFIMIFNRDRASFLGDELHLRVPYEDAERLALAEYKMRHGETAKQDWTGVIKPSLYDTSDVFKRRIQEKLHSMYGDSLLAQQRALEEATRNATPGKGSGEKKNGLWSKPWFRYGVVPAVTLGAGFATAKIAGWELPWEKREEVKQPPATIPKGSIEKKINGG